MLFRLFIAVILLVPYHSFAQEETNETVWEQQVESLAEMNQEESPSVESMKIIWDEVRRHPFPVNRVDEEELSSLKLLTESQLKSFFIYRTLVGSFLSLYELQAIPSWDLETIRNILPFVTLEEPFRMTGTVISSMFKGSNSTLFRTGGRLESLRYGHWRTLPGELGNPLKTMLRYRFSSAPFLEFGFTGEKDAGEAFITRRGFDFNSGHLFIRKMGKIKSFALGDFTVSMGQGLIQWQGMAFHKSVAIAQIKRQGPVLAPYRSAGEFGFQRGVGLSLSAGRWEATVFASKHYHDARMEYDSVLGMNLVRSLMNTGYHTSEKELLTRHNLAETTLGAVIKFKGQGGSIALNAISYQFSSYILKEEAPYRFMSFSGKDWGALSMDYAYNIKGLHVFGEIAIDRQQQKAVLTGLLMAPDPKMDVTILARALGKGYQSLYGNAFTESSLPGNENGIFIGMTLRPAYRWELNLYMDNYWFPWLKYRVDQPSAGQDYLLHLGYKPSKALSMYGRFRAETRLGNLSGGREAFHTLESSQKMQVRLHLEHKLDKKRENRVRVELLWLKNPREEEAKPGYLAYWETHFKNMQGWTVTGRLQFFESEGYETRIYAFENDLPFGYSVPAFYDKGFKTYFTVHRDINLPAALKPLRKLQCWLKYGKMVKKYPSARAGTGWDEWAAASSDFKLQMMVHW